MSRVPPLGRTRTSARFCASSKVTRTCIGPLRTPLPRKIKWLPAGPFPAPKGANTWECQEVELGRFKDLDTARRRLPGLAAQYPGTKVAVWNRNTRAILAETDGY